MSVENKIQWKLTTRRCKREKKRLVIASSTSHPLQSAREIVLNKEYTDRKTTKTALQPIKHTFVDPLSSVLEGSDPLSSFSGNADPLSATASNAVESTQSKTRKNFEDVSPIDACSFVSWENHCSELSKFTTKQHLTLASSFLSSSETGVVKVQNNIPDRTKLPSQTGAERVKARLEQLDSLDEGVGGGGIREMGGLTQEQFSQHLVSLKGEMKEAWNEEQRVKALKITIQCVKALALSPPEIFYPCKFTIISDLLDTLGSLVYERLMQLLGSSQRFEAEETARNWFYKVASIRELLPRVYLEAALLPCYSILPSEEGKGSLKRLILMCRGIGDPLVGAYIRTYIIHVGLKYQQCDVDYIVTAIEDTITSCKWGWNGSGIEEIEVLNEDFERGGIIAERVFYPALKWLLQCLPKSYDSLRSILKLTEDSKGVTQYVIVKSVLKTFPVVLLSPHCMTVIHILDICLAYGEDPQELLVDMASVVTKCSPSEDEKLNVLNSAWLLVIRIRAIQNYLKAASAWLQFTGMNYTSNEMDRILADILKRLSKFTSTSPQTFYLPLLHLLTTALSCNARSEELYTFSSFRGLLSIFQRESGAGVGFNNVTEMKKLLEAALQHHKKDFTDPAVVQLLLSLFASLHDGINALTTQDERRQISHVVNTFIRQVNFGKDFELQLEFYVNARAAFSNLDPVLESLIQHVLRLQISTLRMVKGHHTGKTAAFERACTAYCFITIPSLSCSLMKLKFYLLCGSVAMINNCMGQGDACIKSAVKVILDIASDLSSSPSPSSLVEGVPSAIANAAAYLVAIPDPPDASRPLYLFRGLVNSLKSLTEVVDPLSFWRLNLAVLKGVCASAQDFLPYHFRNVDGNDILYGGEPNLKIEAENICTEILSTIITLLKEVIGASDGQQLNLICDLLGTILIYADISDPKIKSLALSLLSLVKKHSGNAKLKIEIKALFEERQREAMRSTFC